MPSFVRLDEKVGEHRLGTVQLHACRAAAHRWFTTGSHRKAPPGRYSSGGFVDGIVLHQILQRHAMPIELGSGPAGR
jgi:hypothetical protein